MLGSGSGAVQPRAIAAGQQQRVLAAARSSPVRGSPRRGRLQVVAFQPSENGATAAVPTAPPRPRSPSPLRHEDPAIVPPLPSSPPRPASRPASPARLPSPISRSPPPGGVALPPSNGVGLAVAQPAYEVLLTYRPAGRPLDGCTRIWAHAGHSGWSHCEDIELFPSPFDRGVWEGTYAVLASQLANPAHAEVQVVFKGLHSGSDCEVWDNNAGNNWAVSVELSHEGGLVLPSQQGASMRGLVSSLLLRLDALAAGGHITSEQLAVLRNKAWAQDFALIRAYESVRGAADDHALASLLLSRFTFLRRPGLEVVHIASEMVPVAKVGGLGDVVTGLAKAHQQSGVLASIILPKYDCANYSAISELRMVRSIEVAYDGRRIETRVWSGVVEGLPVIFLEPSNGYFWRKAFYGATDDLDRFMFFSRAALEWLLASGKQPDVIHLHDYHTAAVAPLLAEEYRGRGLSHPRCIFTIHNLAFQGWLSPNMLGRIGLDPNRMAQPHHMLDDTRPGFTPGTHDCSLLRGAVVFSDRTTTVSPNYAREVFTPEFGMGAQTVLSQNRHKFSGVLNGIDHESWNPQNDPHLPAHFSTAAPEGKEACKRLLLEELGLPYTRPAWADPRASANAPGVGPHDGLLQFDAASPEGEKGRPLLAVVSRLTVQKGLPLILHGIKTAIARGAQVVVLGTASEPEVQRQWEEMARQYAAGGDARLVLRYDEGLAHRIYAGADMILIPSFFEPCGLTQLISLRYGTIPIVAATGGLADTVKDVSHGGVPEFERNGFVFSGRDESRVEVAVNRAMDSYFGGPEWWRKCLVPRAMSQDWSWSRSAQAYLALYRGMHS